LLDESDLEGVQRMKVKRWPHGFKYLYLKQTLETIAKKKHGNKQYQHKQAVQQQQSDQFKLFASQIEATIETRCVDAIDAVFPDRPRDMASSSTTTTTKRNPLDDLPRYPRRVIERFSKRTPQISQFNRKIQRAYRTAQKSNPTVSSYEHFTHLLDETTAWDAYLVKAVEFACEAMFISTMTSFNALYEDNTMRYSTTFVPIGSEIVLTESETVLRRGTNTQSLFEDLFDTACAKIALRTITHPQFYDHPNELTRQFPKQLAVVGEYWLDGIDDQAYPTTIRQLLDVLSQNVGEQIEKNFVAVNPFLDVAIVSAFSLTIHVPFGVKRTIPEMVGQFQDRFIRFQQAKEQFFNS